jgi:hypothetical protein
VIKGGGGGSGFSPVALHGPNIRLPHIREALARWFSRRAWKTRAKHLVKGPCRMFVEGTTNRNPPTPHHLITPAQMRLSGLILRERGLQPVELGRQYLHTDNLPILHDPLSPMKSRNQ